MALLSNSEKIGKYTVQSLIKFNLYTETYRVEDINQTPFFLKLFIIKRMSNLLIDDKSKMVKEILLCSELHHKNLLDFIEHGVIDKEEGQCQYYVTSYLTGSILSDKISRDGKMAEDEALRIFRSILSGLQYLHSQVPALCHNDLDPSNIMLTDVSESEVQIIDFGHLSGHCSGTVWFPTSDLDVHYHGDESRVGIFDEQGDVFSACAVLYSMLSGTTPWDGAPINSEDDYRTNMNNLRLYRKSNGLDIEKLEVSKKTKFILHYGLEAKITNRFASVQQIIDILDASEANENDNKSDSADSMSASQAREQWRDNPNYVEFDIKKGNGNGFEDIAGMKELKQDMEEQFLFVITHKEIAQEYRLTPPNGLLLYGPPGCGKTFFAEKFAEQAGFNYVIVKSSDLASSYIHGTQEKIKQLFDVAAKNAPIIVCFDEFDALVPDRTQLGDSYSKEVNEFLSQMNNCSQRGIFIIATSNRPDKIDPAVLRTGRVDKSVYVPLPDYEARREMFNIYLDGRPIEDGIDINSLATQTEGYIASDIAYIVNDAATIAAYSRIKISHSLLEKSIHNTHPSLRPDSIKVYEEIRKKMESTDRKNISDRIVVKGL